VFQALEEIAHPKPAHMVVPFSLPLKVDPSSVDLGVLRPGEAAEPRLRGQRRVRGDRGDRAELDAVRLEVFAETQPPSALALPRST
jgi:hypothetical protein